MNEFLKENKNMDINLNVFSLEDTLGFLGHCINEMSMSEISTPLNPSEKKEKVEEMLLKVNRILIDHNLPTLTVNDLIMATINDAYRDPELLLKVQAIRRKILFGSIESMPLLTNLLSNIKLLAFKVCHYVFK